MYTSVYIVSLYCVYLYVSLYIVYIYTHVYMYIYIYILKTLRVTAVSKGDGMMFEQGGYQGIGRNHKDLT